MVCVCALLQKHTYPCCDEASHAATDKHVLLLPFLCFLLPRLLNLGEALKRCNTFRLQSKRTLERLQLCLSAAQHTPSTDWKLECTQRETLFKPLYWRGT